MQKFGWHPAGRFAPRVISKRPAKVFALLVFLVAMLLGGCAPSAGPSEQPTQTALVAWEDWRSDQPPATRPRLTEEEKLAVWEQDWDNNQAWLMERFGVEAPKPEIIRWTGYEEFLPVMVECLQEAGWRVRLVDGGFMGPEGVGVEQTPAFHVSRVVCDFQYPRDPRYAGILDADQNGVVYDYLTQWWIPCMHAKGFSELGNPPTREGYVAGEKEPIPGNSAETASWEPFLHWRFSIHKGDDSPEVQEILADCPRRPPSQALWPS